MSSPIAIRFDHPLLNSRGRLLAILALVASLVGASGGAYAQSCSFSMSNVDFGSINLVANTNFDTSATLSINCTGIAGRIVRVCPSYNAGSGGVHASGNPRYMLNGVNQLRYNLYRNNARTNVWGSYFWGIAGQTPPTVNITLNGAGNGSASRVLRARVFSGQTTLPTGLYTSSFAGAQTQVTYAYSTVGNCTTIGLTNVTQVPFTVRATNVATVGVVAADLDFGPVDLLNSNVDAASSVEVTCPTGLPFRVAMDGGLSAATDPEQRRMTLASEDVLYGLYRNITRTQPWGSTVGTNTYSGTCTGSALSIPVYGRVAPQTTPSPGIYSDSVVVSLTY